MSALAKLYAKAVKDGDRTIKQVPSVIREEVKEILISKGYEELAKEE